MTYEEGRILHRQMWDYIIECLQNELEIMMVLKSRYFKTFNLPKVMNNCYACEYDKQFQGDCENCPIASTGRCMTYGSAYYLLTTSIQEWDKERAVDCAKIIGDAW